MNGVEAGKEEGGGGGGAAFMSSLKTKSLYTGLEKGMSEHITVFSKVLENEAKYSSLFPFQAKSVGC